MKVGISVSPTRSRFGPTLFDNDFDSLCGFISSLGYEGIEVSLISPSALTSECEGSIDRHGLKVFSIATGQSYVQQGICLYSLSDQIRRQAIEKLQSFIPLAQAHSCPIIVGGIRGNEQVPEDKLDCVKLSGDAALTEFAESARERGVTVLLEPINRYESRFYNSVSSCAHMIGEKAAGNVRILADTFHMNIEEQSINDAVTKNLPAIGYLHIADSNRLFPGAGHIDFRSFFSAIRSCNYNGIVGLEVLPVPDAREAALRSFRNLQPYIKEGTAY